MQLNDTTRWIIQIAVTLMGILLAATVSLSTFVKQTAKTHKNQEINLAIDLAKEFDKSELFRNIRMSIEHQQHLYKSWGGSFDNDQINLYLNFFEDVGFYHKYGVLSLEIIDHYYGSYMIEAYENKEIQQYITDLRVNYKQADAFAEFETVTKEIEALPSRGALTALMRRVNKE